MIEVEVKSDRRWERIPNGPFPLTLQQFVNARRHLRERKALATDIDRLGGCWVTEARAILKLIAPNLSEFDLLCLGNGVAMEMVRVVEVDQ